MALELIPTPLVISDVITNGAKKKAVMISWLFILQDLRETFVLYSVLQQIFLGRQKACVLMYFFKEEKCVLM